MLEREGAERAHYLLEKLIDKARRSGAYLPYKAQTAYLNTIPPHMEARSPGDPALEDFFTEEYQLDHLIHNYPKPSIALMEIGRMPSAAGMTTSTMISSARGARWVVGRSVVPSRTRAVPDRFSCSS